MASASDLCSNQHVPPAFASGFKCMWTINGKNQFLASTKSNPHGCMPVNKDPGYTSTTACATSEESGLTAFVQAHPGKSILIFTLILSALLLVLMNHGEY